jgi:hypothetical protein
MMVRKKINIIFLLSFLLMASAPDGTREVVVVLQPESSISIHGESNINTFDFVQSGVFIEPSIKILLNQNTQGLLTNSVSLPVDVRKFTCSNKKMLSDFLDLLNAEKYPVMNITVYKINIKTETTSTDKDFYTGNVIVSITLAGVTSLYSIPFDAVSTSDRFVILGGKILRFSDFKLTPPVKFMGLIKVKNELHVQLKLVVEA